MSAQHLTRGSRRIYVFFNSPNQTSPGIYVCLLYILLRFSSQFSNLVHKQAHVKCSMFVDGACLITFQSSNMYNTLCIYSSSEVEFKRESNFGDKNSTLRRFFLGGGVVHPLGANASQKHRYLSSLDVFSHIQTVLVREIVC